MRLQGYLLLFLTVVALSVVLVQWQVNGVFAWKVVGMVAVTGGLFLGNVVMMKHK